MFVCDQSNLGLNHHLELEASTRLDSIVHPIMQIHDAFALDGREQRPRKLWEIEIQ